MKNTHSAEELQEKANVAFADYPHVNTVYATVDGNVFLEKNRANLHAGTGRVYPFYRPIETAEDTEENEQADKPLNATDTIKAIKEVTNLEDLEKYATDTRPTVLKAYELRKKAIEAADKIQAGDSTNAVTGTTPAQ